MSAFVTVIVPSCCQISVLHLQACLSHSSSVFPSCLSLFFSLVCTCVPRALSLSMSVCLPSPHWYALLPSTLSLTLHMIILFSLPFFLSLSLSSSLIVAFFVYLCFSLSSALPMFVFVVFPSLFLFPCSPTPPPPSFPGCGCCCCCCLLPSLRARERRKRRIKGQREESRLHFLLLSPVNTYVCCLPPKWRRQKTTGREMLDGNQRSEYCLISCQAESKHWTKLVYLKCNMHTFTVINVLLFFLIENTQILRLRTT